MQIFVLIDTDSIFPEESIVAVFSSLEKAQAYLEEKNLRKESHTILDFFLDPV